MAQVICDEYSNKSLIFKPLYLCFEAFRIYNKLLASNPITTKSITSGILGAAGATVSSLLNTVSNDYKFRAEINHISGMFQPANGCFEPRSVVEISFSSFSSFLPHFEAKSKKLQEKEEKT